MFTITIISLENTEEVNVVVKLRRARLFFDY